MIQINLNRFSNSNFFSNPLNKERNSFAGFNNLAPLSKDTVSFSGSRKLIAKDMSNAPTENLCRDVAAYAEPARFYLETVLNKYVQPYIEASSPFDSTKYPVFAYETRVKTPRSIREKVVSKHSKMSDEFKENNDPNKKALPSPTSTKGVKYYANDIVGGRIIMKNADPKYTGTVLSALKSAAQDGLLHITSIENNVPDPKKLPRGKHIYDYIYATNAQLRSLAKAANAELIENKSHSGYMGIHINLAMDNPILNNYDGKFKGYTGEIQIIGSDVSKLKEVEDLCYKLKDDKNAINAAYEPFKEHFQKYYKDKKVKKAFDDYTYALYLAQRAILPKAKRKSNFPSIKELGFEGRVPQELDFNVLASLKSRCDNNLAHILIEEDMKDLVGNETKKGLKQIKQKGDIKTMKSLISYEMK